MKLERTGFDSWPCPMCENLDTVFQKWSSCHLTPPRPAQQSELPSVLMVKHASPDLISDNPSRRPSPSRTLGTLCCRMHPVVQHFAPSYTQLPQPPGQLLRIPQGPFQISPEGSLPGHHGSNVPTPSCFVPVHLLSRP